MTFRVLIAEDKKLETYIRVSDAISLCREYGELYYLRKEFEHIEKWAERQQQGNEYGGRRGGEERDDEWLCRFIWEQDAVVLAFKNRVVLFRKGDGEVEYRCVYGFLVSPSAPFPSHPPHLSSLFLDCCCTYYA